MLLKGFVQIIKNTASISRTLSIFKDLKKELKEKEAVVMLEL